MSLVGTVLGSEGGAPVRVEYRVLTDPAGFTTAVHVRDLRGFEQRTLTLNRDPKGSWTIDGQSAGRSRAAPTSTSAAARRRTRCRSGAWGSVSAPRRHPGRLDPVPALTVEKAAQTYTRLDEFTYRYASRTFEAELTVDDDGLVAQYAEWRRTGIAFGPE